MQRWIIHVDMDAFYASIEQRDHPELRGKPVIVGGIGPRGVVSTASYEARIFGVRSAMPVTQARRLCPDGIYLRPDHAKYAQVSAQIQNILHEFSPLVEPLSLDEAFLDVTGMEWQETDPAVIARQIKERIARETGLTASAGVAPNKILAKLASDLGKPDGLFVIRPGEEKTVLHDLPVRRLWGVGAATADVLRRLRLETIGQVAATAPEKLEPYLGKLAYHLHLLANGRDERPVEPEAAAKSIGKELTFETDLTNKEEMLAYILDLSEKVGWRLRCASLAGRTVTLKVRYASFKTITRSRTLASPVCMDEAIYGICRELFQRIALPEGIRLLGVTVSHLEEESSQLCLFEEADTGKRKAMYQAIDRLKERFGENVISRGGLLRAEGKEEPY